ncbi:hypothetical protein HPP92_029160 [Vanilla planifolia]|uniref:Uncharacterized protein n=1 Tax=Vanilla planifolia TaxID=51239 RepID=A0A835P5V7_VANPL|nr:hypothetical protein HPP92_029160 [Vanilla planifolia]KAG0445817.1 hypothetical protein HPP92_029149 [Vanilla planifolia]
MATMSWSYQDLIECMHESRLKRALCCSWLSVAEIEKTCWPTLLKTELMKNNQHKKQAKTGGNRPRVGGALTTTVATGGSTQTKSIPTETNYVNDEAI